MDARRLVPLLLAVLLLPGCDIPRDPEGTLDRVRGGVMRVGLVPNDPWVRVQDAGPAGVEVELVEAFAAELEAEIEWVEGSEQEVFGALELLQLDLVIGGLVNKNPYGAHSSFTHSYITTFVGVGVPSSDPVPEGIARLEVGVERGTEIVALLEGAGAIPVLVDDVAAHEGPVAVEGWLFDDLDLRDTGVRLIEPDHVMAVPMGENGWQVRLEEFLLDNEERARDLLEQEDRP